MVFLLLFGLQKKHQGVSEGRRLMGMRITIRILCCGTEGEERTENKSFDFQKSPDAMYIVQKPPFCYIFTNI